jgi:ferredoxin
MDSVPGAARRVVSATRDVPHEPPQRSKRARDSHLRGRQIIELSGRALHRPSGKTTETMIFLPSALGIPEGPGMAYVINEPCIGTKDRSCMDVCPVDPIHPTRDEPLFGQLRIDPGERIDCDARIEPCPVDAIARASTVPAGWRDSVGGSVGHYRAEP